MLNSLKLLILIFGIGVFFPSPIYAQEYSFQEEFDHERPANVLDETKWNVYPNVPVGITSIQEVGGVLKTLQPGKVAQFPYVVSKKPVIPAGEFVAEIKFKYTSIGFWGTGIVFSEKAPVNREQLGTSFIIDVWQDNSLPPSMRIEYDGQIVYQLPVNVDNHLVKIAFKEQKYWVYLDNNLVFTSPTIANKLKYLWMGNPTVQEPPYQFWSTFEVDYIRIQDLTPTKTPVILIPGIGGSEFKATGDINWSAPDGHGGVFDLIYKNNESVWFNYDKADDFGEDDYFDVLRLKPDGETAEANLTLTGNLFTGYQELINFLLAKGYVLDQDLFLFPYDWRKDISLTELPLDEKISQIKQQTNSQQVDIIAHSMGGLVARNYIQDVDKAQNIRKLITLGTPYLGSVDALKALMYGKCLTEPPYDKVQPLACLGIPPSEVKDVFQNFTSGYQLLPSKTFFDFYNDSNNLYPSPFKDVRDIDENKIGGVLNYDQTKTLLTNLGYNTALFQYAEPLHNQDLFTNTNGLDVSIIVGSGLGTLGQIIEGYAVDFAGFKIKKTDQLSINGDGTVPLYSASLSDSSRNLFLTGQARVYYAEQEHGALVANGPALNLVGNLLKDNANLPAGIENTPYKLYGKQLSVHSPVNLHVYDRDGNHTGLDVNGNIEVNIPGSSYDSLDDAKFVWLPENGVYTIKFESTGQGSFDFKIKDYADDVLQKTAVYKNIPLTSLTIGEAIFDTQSEQLPTLKMDQEGDGRIDNFIELTSILDQTSSNDHTPPSTVINIIGEEGSNNWYKTELTIELLANDENGSGVEKIEYSLDGGKTVFMYESPIIISNEGITNFKFRAIDKAGNEEIPQEIELKIDKSAPEIKLQFNLETQNIDLIGMDNLTYVTKDESLGGKTLLKDAAGNTTVIALERHHQEDKLSIKDITYNQGLTLQLPNNQFKVNYQPSKSDQLIKKFDQKIVIADNEKLDASFNAKQDLTQITAKELENKKQIIEKSGMALLYLYTDKGQLKTQYTQ